MTFALVDAVPNGSGWEGTWSGPPNYVIILVARDCFVRKRKLFLRHIIKFLLIKLVRSRLLHIGLVLFFASLGPSTCIKRINLANIQPFGITLGK